ncbi:MAG: metallophosphoesterase [Methanosarcinales archaeon]|jgi:putative phosphoesterase|nr:metallophosphoesterase [Methanosarcinales archaeon]
MKILVISDTHLPEFDSEKAVNMNKSDLTDFSFFPEILRQKIREADIVIHAGDFESEDAYRLFQKTGKLKAVFGNRDPETVQKALPEKLIFEECGIKFGVVHQAGISLNDNTARWYILKEMGADILIYGHIHTPSIEEYGGQFLLCPGSPTKARMSEPSVAEIIIDENQKKISSIQIIQVGQAACGFIKFREELIEKSEKE